MFYLPEVLKERDFSDYSLIAIAPGYRCNSTKKTRDWAMSLPEYVASNADRFKLKAVGKVDCGTIITLEDERMMGIFFPTTSWVDLALLKSDFKDEHSHGVSLVEMLVAYDIQPVSVPKNITVHPNGTKDVYRTRAINPKDYPSSRQIYDLLVMLDERR